MLSWWVSLQALCAEYLVTSMGLLGIGRNLKGMILWQNTQAKAIDARVYFSSHFKGNLCGREVKAFGTWSSWWHHIHDQEDSNGHCSAAFSIYRVPDPIQFREQSYHRGWVFLPHQCNQDNLPQAHLEAHLQGFWIMSNWQAQWILARDIYIIGSLPLEETELPNPFLVSCTTM